MGWDQRVSATFFCFCCKILLMILIYPQKTYSVSDLGLIESRVNDWATENGIYSLGPTPVKAEQSDPDVMITTPSITTTTATAINTGSTNLFYPSQPTNIFSSKPQTIPGKKPYAKARSASTSPNTHSFMSMFASQPTHSLTPFGNSLTPDNHLNNNNNHINHLSATNFKPQQPQQSKPVSPRPQTRTYSFDQFASPTVGGNAFKPPPPIAPTTTTAATLQPPLSTQSDYSAVGDVDQTTTSILQTILSELKEVKMSHHELMKEQQALRGEILHLQSPPTSPTDPTSPPLFPSSFGAATGNPQQQQGAPAGAGAFGGEGGYPSYPSQGDLNGSPQSPIFIPGSPGFASVGYTPPVSPGFTTTTSTQGTFYGQKHTPPQQADPDKPSNIALFSVPGMRATSPQPTTQDSNSTNNANTAGGNMRFPTPGVQQPSREPYWRATSMAPMKAPPRRASVPGKATSLPMMAPNVTAGRFRYLLLPFFVDILTYVCIPIIEQHSTAILAIATYQRLCPPQHYLLSKRVLAHPNRLSRWSRRQPPLPEPGWPHGFPSLLKIPQSLLRSLPRMEQMLYLRWSTIPFASSTAIKG